MKYRYPVGDNNIDDPDTTMSLAQCIKYAHDSKKDVPDFDRLESAERCFQSWWHIYNGYCSWAFHYLAGRMFILENAQLSEIRKDWGTEIPLSFDRAFELVGVLLLRPDADYGYVREEFPDEIKTLFDEARPRLSDSQQRRLFVQISGYHDSLMGVVTPWNAPISEALENAEAGTSNSLLVAAKGKHGNASLIREGRKLAILHAYFLAGKEDINLLQARTQIALDLEPCSVSSLRSWETELKSDEFFRFQIECSYRAGKCEEELRHVADRQMFDDQKAWLNALSMHWAITQEKFYSTGMLKHGKRLGHEEARSIIYYLDQNPINLVRDKLAAKR